MNHHAPSPAEGLFNAIARRWMLPAPAASLAISADGATLAVARADGALSLVPLTDPEPPDGRIHVSADSGRATINMRQNGPAPAIGTAVLSASPLPIAPYGAAGFLAGTADGRLLNIHPNGEVTELAAALPSAVTQIAHSTAAGLYACVSGPRLFLLPEDGTAACPVLDAAVTALAFAPDGHQLAVGLEGEVAVLDQHGTRLRTISIPGRPSVLAWHPAGAGLTAALGAQGLAMIDLATGRSSVFGDFPTPVQSLAWSTPARALVAAGAFRIAAWAETALAGGDSRTGALVSGHTGLVPVQVVAPHPKLRLAAAGYVNGQVVVAPIGRAEELPVQPVGAPIAALAWSANGQLISAGTDGSLAIMTFPSRLFK